VDNKWTIAVRTAEENLSNVRVALPPDFFTKGCLNQTWRASHWSQHTTRVFVDPDLLQYDEVWAAAGTWNDNFGAAPADIVRVAGGVVTT
jgi:hypothetical protein